MLIIAQNYIQPERLNEVRKIYEEVVQYTRKQPGCISYNVYQESANPTSLIFIEEWNSKDDLSVHLEDQGFLNIFSTIEKCFIKDEVMKEYELFIK